MTAFLSLGNPSSKASNLRVVLEPPSTEVTIRDAWRNLPPK